MNSDTVPTLRITPSSGWVPVRLSELWEYRELIYFLVWRDIKVRYKQTLLGVAWAIIQPLFTMIVFSLFFGRLAKLPSDGLPYPIFSYVALLPWTFFANGVSQASNSLTGASNLLKKVYFPRLALPLSAVLSGIVDLGFSSVALIGLMVYYQVPPSMNLVWMPLIVALALTTALGTALWLSAMNALFRDVRFAVPFLLQLWLFATPVVYPSTLLPPVARILYGVNPMVGVVEGFRWAVLGLETVPPLMILLSSAVSLTILVTGAYYFRSMERKFVDVI